MNRAPIASSDLRGGATPRRRERSRRGCRADSSNTIRRREAALAHAGASTVSRRAGPFCRPFCDGNSAHLCKMLDRRNVGSVLGVKLAKEIRRQSRHRIQHRRTDRRIVRIDGRFESGKRAEAALARSGVRSVEARFTTTTLSRPLSARKRAKVSPTAVAPLYCCSKECSPVQRAAEVLF